MPSVKAKRAPLSERKLANKVFSRAELRGIRLHSCSAKHNFGLGARRQLKHIEMSVDIEPVGLETHQQLSVTVSLRVVGKPPDDDRHSLEIECAFTLAYSLESFDGIDEKHVQAFTHFIVLNNVWPYAREFVQDISQRLGFPPLRLPLYKPENMDRTSPPSENS